MYACGVHLHKMLFDMYPFGGATADQMVKNVLAGARSLVPPGHEEFVPLIDRMLCKDWQQRISIDEIQQHPVYLKDLPPELEVHFGLPSSLCAVHPVVVSVRVCNGAWAFPFSLDLWRASPHHNMVPRHVPPMAAGEHKTQRMQAGGQGLPEYRGSAQTLADVQRIFQAAFRQPVEQHGVAAPASSAQVEA